MKFRTLLELGRVSNLPTVWSNMAAGWLLGGGEWAWGLTWAIVGGSLLYLSGMAMNDACDAGWDKKHKGDRPIVCGQISRRSVWILTGIYGVGGLAALGFGAKSCPIWIGGLAVVIIAYNVIHKHWSGSTWLMGACRFFLYLVAASAASGGGNPSVDSIVWGGALGLYVVGLTYVARGESSGAALIRWPLFLLFAPACLWSVDRHRFIGHSSLDNHFPVGIRGMGGIWPSGSEGNGKGSDRKGCGVAFGWNGGH